MSFFGLEITKTVNRELKLKISLDCKERWPLSDEVMICIIQAATNNLNPGKIIGNMSRTLIAGNLDIFHVNTSPIRLTIFGSSLRNAYFLKFKAIGKMILFPTIEN